MDKNLSIILSTAACAALIAAAGLSQSSAQQAPAPQAPQEEGYSPARTQGSQSKGSMHEAAKDTMQEGATKSTTMKDKATGDTRTVMERATDTAPGNARMVTLTVKDVDREAHMVTFQAKVSPEANIKRDGMPIKLDQLQEGDSLRVIFDPRTGEMMRAEVLKKARQ